MKNPLLIVLMVAGLLVGCGGSGGGGLAGPQTGTAGCSLDGQKDFVLEAMRDIYFWNDLLPTNVDLSQFQTPEELLVFLTDVQPLDRFSFIDSAAADAAFFNEGESVAFGLRFTFVDTNDVRIVTVTGGSPAEDGGLERGQQLLSIDGRSVAEIEANEGLREAFGPEEVGIVRTLRMRDPGTGAEFDAVLTKAVITTDPVPQIRTFSIGGTTYGYFELTTFIRTAEAQLDAVFAEFNVLGINEIIIDVRYNGGGLVSVAELLGDYLGGSMSVAQGEVFSDTLFNDDNIERNSTEFFENRAQSLDLQSVVFITTGGTASASELVINSMEPWVTQVGLVGSTTFGKPVGQVGLLFCEKILRPTAFETVNSLGEGQYFDGLPVDCAAADDLDFPIGDGQEASTAAALTLLSTGACPPAQVREGQGSQITRFRPPAGRTATQVNSYIY